jgi:Secretion system C-terminal sorting domain/FG-GAP-like repeat
MRKILLLQSVLLICSIGNSQTLNFTLANPQPNIMEGYGGTFASGDIDGDGDIDLFMTGITPQIWTRLYFNNGSGNFTEATHNFPRSGNSQAFLIDLDGDGDLDLFFSGQNELAQKFVNIYRNNGSGTFTQVPNTLPVFIKGAAIADVDNDGDLDLAITTATTAGIYLNNGNAVFTPQGNSVFTPVDGIVQIIDIENDGDQDVIISGSNTIKLYQNNGSGVFTLNTNSTFPAISAEGIEVADTDNDGDLDLLINGNTQNLLYINNGTGLFNQTSTNLQQTFAGRNAFADLDNDGDKDLLTVGSQAGGLPNIFNIVYRNDGNNTFVQTQILGGEYIADCVISDFNGDGLKDIIIQGFADDTNVYWNTSTVLSITEQITTNNSINFYPNPAKDFINFKLNDESVITVYNTVGQKVLTKKNNLKEFLLDISNLTNGTYIIELNDNGISKTAKFIKH